MSRIAKQPIEIPNGVEVTLSGDLVTVKGAKGSLQQNLHQHVEMKQEGKTLVFAARKEVPGAWAQAGTARAVISNLVKGVSKGLSVSWTWSALVTAPRRRVKT